MQNTPFAKKPNFNENSIQKLQIETDDIDDETKKIIDQKSLEQFTNENAIISQEIEKINEEFSDINEKSSNIELLLKSQQQCISILNKDNEDLKVIADQVIQKLTAKSNGKHKKSKSIKESDLFNQIHLSIEKQDSINQNALSTIQNDKQIQQIAAIRKANLLSSSNFLSNFDQIILKRQNIIERYKEYSKEMTTHTKRKQLFDEYEVLLKENQELKEIYSKKIQQKQLFEQEKKNLADIENSLNEIEQIKKRTKIIEADIENKKSYPGFSQVFQLDAQITQSQYNDSQIYSSIGCNTEGPIFSSASDEQLKHKINEYEKDISDFQQQKERESAEMKRELETLREQHQEICNQIDLFIKHLSDMHS